MSDSTMFFYLPLLISIVLIFTVFITYRVKNRFVLWTLILIPPLFLVPLYRINRDLITAIIWTPAYVALIWSIISIIINIIRAIVRLLTKKPKVRLFKTRFVRPSLVIIIFLFINFTVNLSMTSADNYGMAISKKIQIEANANGICPNKIKGWADTPQDWVDCQTWYGDYGTKYLLRYMVSDDKKEFTIQIKHNIDEAVNISGGVNKPLKAEKWVEEKTIEIPISDYNQTIQD